MGLIQRVFLSMIMATPFSIRLHKETKTVHSEISCFFSCQQLQLIKTKACYTCNVKISKNVIMVKAINEMAEIMILLVKSSKH